VNTGTLARLRDTGNGACEVSGPLTFSSCDALWRALESGGALRSARSADLSGVDAADSAGLALLLAWRAARIEAGGDLQFDAVPQRLRLLARLTGAEPLLDD
jgi:phospholipid transport system transporter-binding protein